MGTQPAPDQAPGSLKPDPDLAHTLAFARSVLVAPEQSPEHHAALSVRALEVLAAQLLRPPVLGPGQTRQTLLWRLAQLLQRLLAAQAVTLLLPDEARGRYVAVREAESGAWLPGSDDIPLAAPPLPQLLDLGAGLLLSRSSAKGPLDWAIRRLVGRGPALLLPIGTGSTAAGALIAHLPHPPRDGEALLALLLCLRAGALLAGRAPVGSISAAPRLTEPARTGVERHAMPALSVRQLEVARLLAAGLRNKEIAAHLGIREKTVKFHLGHIYGKLGAQSRTEALLALFQHGLADVAAQPTHRGDPPASETPP